MIVLATINREDNPGEEVVLLGYEVVEDPGFPVEMCLGIQSDNGDDTIFAFVSTEEELVAEIDRRWGDWASFDWLGMTLTDEEYWNGQ